MKGFVKEFRDFIATGNMIELAVAVILGAAVKAVIDVFTNGILMQIVAAIFGKPNFDDVTVTLRENGPGVEDDAVLQIGTFINTLITLMLTGLVLFMIIKGYNHMKQRRQAEVAVVEAITAPVGPTEIELLTEIRDSLRTR